MRNERPNHLVKLCISHGFTELKSVWFVGWCCDFCLSDVLEWFFRTVFYSLRDLGWIMCWAIWPICFVLLKIQNFTSGISSNNLISISNYIVMCWPWLVSNHGKILVTPPNPECSLYVRHPVLTIISSIQESVDLRRQAVMSNQINDTRGRKFSKRLVDIRELNEQAKVIDDLK